MINAICNAKTVVLYWDLPQNYHEGNVYKISLNNFNIFSPNKLSSYHNLECQILNYKFLLKILIYHMWQIHNLIIMTSSAYLTILVALIPSPTPVTNGNKSTASPTRPAQAQDLLD